MLTNLFLGQTAEEKNFIEDLFSCYLYTGNGSTQTITNGIDLAGKGGLVWLKRRSSAGQHTLWDTNRGVGNFISSNLTDANTNLVAGTGTNNYDLNAFNSNGFGLGIDAFFTNASGTEMCAWTFRKAAKFFDVVTYTGDGSSSLQVNHNLGVTPGMVIIKRTDVAANWVAAVRKDSGTLSFLYLNTTGSTIGNVGYYPSSSVYVSPTTFGPGWFKYGGVTVAETNASGGSYVAYLFAHDTTADGVIQCGSYTGNTTTPPQVNLGWEPQFVLVKSVATGGWVICDNMRGASLTSGRALEANSSTAEYDPGGATAPIVIPNATGFTFTTASNAYWNSSGTNFIYMAIRRGPMRTPTDATKVFYPFTTTTNSTIPSVTTSTIGFQSVDLWFNSAISGTYGASVNYSNRLSTRLTGFGTSTSKALVTSATSAEADYGYSSISDGGLTYTTPATSWGTTKFAWYFLRRAPGFFDVVCYTGTGSNTTQSHNLGVVPELIIIKRRSTTGNWTVQSSYLPNGFSYDTGTGTYGYAMNLNLTGAAASQGYISGVTSTVFNPSTGATITNNSGTTYVAYLFATCPGVSKVGTYTGTGTTQQINCGFTAGARFVLIKRTDSTGDWTVWDTARGIVSGNDPYLLLNSTAAEVTNTDYIDPLSTGFEISSTAPAAINANGGTFVFLAIA